MNPKIYGLKDPRSGEIRYVGKTTNPPKRFFQHLQRSPSIRMRNWILDLKSIGMKPVMEILEECEPSNWSDRERFWISEYSKTNTGILNVLSGGDGCDFFTNGWRLIHAAAMKKLKSNKKWRKSVRSCWMNPEFLARHRETMKRVTSSCEWKKAQADGCRRIHQDPDVMRRKIKLISKINSDPIIMRKRSRRLKEVMKTDWFQKNYLLGAVKRRKPLLQINPKTGIVIREFSSGREASSAIGICVGAISDAARGKRLKTAGGFKWSFKETDENEKFLVN